MAYDMEMERAMEQGADAMSRERQERAEAHAEHDWDRTGERCLRCGAKDWMGGECTAAHLDTPPGPDAQAEVESDEDQCENCDALATTWDNAEDCVPLCEECKTILEAADAPVPPVAESRESAEGSEYPSIEVMRSLDAFPTGNDYVASNIWWNEVKPENRERAAKTMHAQRSAYLRCIARLSAATPPPSASEACAELPHETEQHRRDAEQAMNCAASAGYRHMILDGEDHARSARHVYAELLAYRDSYRAQAQRIAELETAVRPFAEAVGTRSEPGAKWIGWMGVSTSQVHAWQDAATKALEASNER